MNRRLILAGRLLLSLVLLAVLGIGIIWFRNRSQTPKLTVSIPTPNPEIENRLKENFNIQIPETADKAQLVPAQGEEGEGIATREKKQDFSVYTILANLPDPKSGNHYQWWLVKGKEGEPSYTILTAGTLRVAKGGWLGEFTSPVSDFDRVLISLESKATAAAPGKVILTGSF